MILVKRGFFVEPSPFPNPVFVCARVCSCAWPSGACVSPQSIDSPPPAASSFSVPASRRSNWKGSECQPLSVCAHACVCVCVYVCVCAPVFTVCGSMFLSLKLPWALCYDGSANLLGCELFPHFPCLAHCFKTQNHSLKRTKCMHEVGWKKILWQVNSNLFCKSVIHCLLLQLCTGTRCFSSCVCVRPGPVRVAAPLWDFPCID